MRLLSPAKINLFFQVLNKRSDGYHEIASLFQAIDLCDVLELRLASEDRITCSDPTLACDASNLIHKAREEFRSSFPLPPVHIHLTKRIPIQSGLGGGSGNAATALWGFSHLVDYRVSEDQLREMGAKIGSDVPFFFSTGTAYCTGRGELVSSLKSPVEENNSFFSCSGWVAKPFFGLSTPLVYKNTCVDLLPYRDPLQILDAFTLGTPIYFNDLEISSFQLEPRLIAMKKELLKQFEIVLMTGSGTAFFCLKPLVSTIQPMEEVVFYPFSSLARKEMKWYIE